jgi:hypothetical protein
MSDRKKWTRDRACDYCQSQGVGKELCTHYRGGKTARKKGK